MNVREELQWIGAPATWSGTSPSPAACLQTSRAGSEFWFCSSYGVLGMSLPLSNLSLLVRKMGMTLHTAELLECAHGKCACKHAFAQGMCSCARESCCFSLQAIQLETQIPS
jgi:hypothetical protein